MNTPNMKTLSIQTTIYPSGERKQWVSGMPVHKYRELHTNQYNQWMQYICNMSMQTKMWNKIINRIKPGGVCHQEGQESALKLAKEILG